MTATDNQQQTAAPKKTPSPKAKAKSKPKTKSNGEVKTAVVNISDFTLAEKWNREAIGDIKGLVQSIKERGLQVALTVRPDPKKKGKYEIIDGRRRYAALQEAGVKRVSVVIHQLDNDGDAFLNSLLINLQREDNTDYERALGFGKCIEHGMTGKDIARACGKTEGFVSHRLSILKLPKKWQNEVKEGSLSVSHARIVASLFDSEDKKDATFAEKLLERFVAGKLTTTAGQERRDKYLEKKAATAEAKGEVPKGKTKKGAKGTSKTAKSKSDDGTPKKEFETEYTPEVKKVMKMIDLDSNIEWLQHYEERLSRTTSEKNRTRLKGIIEGLEIAGGLRE